MKEKCESQSPRVRGRSESFELRRWGNEWVAIVTCWRCHLTGLPLRAQADLEQKDDNPKEKLKDGRPG